MIKAEKRFLAFVLALVMICAVLPWQAYAATSVSLLDGKVTLAATSVQGTMSDLVGGVVTVPATPSYDSCSKSYSGTSSTVKFTNNSGNQATISFTYTKNSYVSSVTINGTANTTGSASVNVAANNGNFTVVVKGVDGTDQVAEIYLTDFKIVEQKEVTLTYGSAVNGSFTVNSAAVAAGGKLTVLTTDTVALSASPAANYSFAGWYNEVTGKYFSFDKNASVQFEDSATIVPKFIPSADAVFGIGDAVFASLDDAIASAIMGSVIFPLKNVTLTKDYTIPANVTLLVPFNAEHTCYTDADIKTASYVAPSVYRTLTLADGVTLTVNGAISVSAKHVPCDGANPTKGGTVSGPYGLLKLNGNSKVDIQNGGVLYAWGYVIGSGEVVANSGATIHEIMQVTDFRGGNGTLGLAGVDKGKRVFPFSQYYVQNVEAKEVFHAGSKLMTTASITMSGDTTSMAVTFIGEGGMFTLSEGTVVTKEYDATNDRLNISSSGNVTLSGISLTFSGQPISSSDFYLPINSNITININSGVATVNQDLVMHPGSELTIAKGAQIFIPAGIEVFVYDADNWGNFVFKSTKYSPLTYIASTGKASTRGTPGDAIVNVNGTIGVAGSVYTSAAGAQIISTEGDGVFFHMAAAPMATSIYGCTANGSAFSSGTFTSVAMNPADLRNGDGSVTSTLNATQYAGFVYNKTTETWETLTDAVITFDANGGTGSMDAQTITMLNLAQGVKTALTGNAFSNGSAIFLGWSTTKDGEVVYQDGEEVLIYRDTTLYAKWQPTAVEITWIDGAKNPTVEVTYGAAPSYPLSTPTKAQSGCTTYTFAGWSTEANGGGTKYPVGTNLPAANADATYYAYFTESTSHVGDTDNDHKCNGCSTPLTDCADTNNDHICDYAGCKDTLSSCVDENADHICDLSGCKATLSSCVDENADHICDLSGCKATLSSCVDANNDHICDYAGCKATLSSCVDANNDHICDYAGCKATLSTCVDDDRDHYCDYSGCKAELSTCVDGDDENHNCDYVGCGKENVDDGCHGGKATCMAAAVCDECGQPYGSKDATNHTKQNTTVKDAVTETCGKEGYTGDTYCECGEKIATGTSIPATGKHYDNPTDGNHSCDVCNAANVTKCSGGTAYCNALAVCSDCGESHGEFDKDNHASSNFTFVDNKNGTHTKKHACCSAEVVTEGHTYVNGHCDCEAVQTFTVTWVDAAGKAVDSETVTYGGNATKTPAVPTKDGYTGVWNKTATNVTSDVTITPVYTIKSYQISFDTDGDGTVNYSASYNHFANLAIPTPVLPQNNAQYTYAFDCWKDQNGNVVDANTVVTGAMTVTMYYTATINTYTVTWDVNGVKTEQTYKYGETPVFSGSTDKAADGCTTYTFDGWDKDIVAVTGDVTYTAEYTTGISHTGELEYTHVDEWSHKVTWSCCGAVVSEEAEHEDGDDDGYCDCGGVFIRILLNESTIYGEEMENGWQYIFVKPGSTYTTDVGPATGWGKVTVQIYDAGNDTSVINRNATQLVLGPEYTSAFNEDLTIFVYSYAEIIIDLNGGEAIDEFVGAFSEYDPENGIAVFDLPTGSFTEFDMLKDAFVREGYTLIGITDGQTTYTGDENITSDGEDLHLTLIWKADHVCSENLTEVEAVEADCDTNGVKAYWSCSCGKYYADANASTEIPDLAAWKNGDGKIEKLGHGHTAGLYYEEDDENHHTVFCNDCDAAIKGNVKCTDAMDDGDHKCDFCPNENITGHSYDPATHECECGALETFTVTWLLNGGVMDEQWKQQLISEGFTVTDTSVSGTFPYGDFAPHAPGVTKDGYILIGYTDQNGKFNEGQESFTLTEDMTYTMVWECAHSEVTYTDLGNGFHKVTCDACSETLVESEGHDYTYDKRYHKCQCGAVEEFKLTVVYGINGEYSFEIMVPYWTRMDSLDEINNIPWDIYANDATHFGRFFVDDYFWDMDGDGDLDRDRYFTEGYMTDEDMYVEVRYDFNGFVHDGNGWKYRKYGSFYKDEMITLTEYDVYENGSDEVIEGFYMVGADGYRIENGLGRWYYLGPWNGVTYEPNAEDIAYCESKGQTFIDKEMTWYYFGADGKLAFDYTGLVGDSYVINGQAAWHVGLVEIDGEYYYFKGDEVNGGNVMVTGCDYYLSRNNTSFNMVVGGIYTFDHDGVMQHLFHGIVESDLFEGKRHYIGGRLTPGLGLMDLITVATGEVRYFYVDAYGQLILDAEYYIGANSLGIPKGVYYFDAEGFLVMPEADPLKNGFYFENGNWFYYVDGVKGYCAGLISTSGILWFETADAQGVENEGWVYVKSNGALATGEYYVTNVQENCVSGVKSGDLCKFGSNGLMQTAKSGIVDGYYYENNTIAYGAGLIEIDGSYYYVRSNGQVVMGRSYWITKTNGLKDAGCYEFDADGKMIVSDKNGVVAEDGALYYYVDGIKQIGNGLVKLEDGSYIYVRSNGQLATGLYWTTNHNGVLTEGMYDFGENGILVIE